jgi:hypothetical protein
VALTPATVKTFGRVLRIDCGFRKMAVKSPQEYSAFGLKYPVEVSANVTLVDAFCKVVEISVQLRQVHTNPPIRN